MLAQNLWHDSITIDRILDAIEAVDYIGFCLICGNEQCEVEPDAQEYECESCGAPQVYGAEELFIAIGE